MQRRALYFSGKMANFENHRNFDYYTYLIEISDFNPIW